MQGMRGKGKTNYIKWKLLDISPLYVVDIRNEFKHIPAFITLNHFLYWLNDKRNPKYLKYPPAHLLEFHRENQFRFTFNTSSEWEALFKLMSKFRNCTIVYDEADALFTNRKFERPLIDVSLGARNNNVSLFFIGKRPSLIPIMVRSQADTFVIFCVEEEYDIRYLEKRVKSNFPKDAYKLERGEAIVFKSGEKPMLVQFDKFRGDN